MCVCVCVICGRGMNCGWVGVGVTLRAWVGVPGRGRDNEGVGGRASGRISHTKQKKNKENITKWTPHRHTPCQTHASPRHAIQMTHARHSQSAWALAALGHHIQGRTIFRERREDIQVCDRQCNTIRFFTLLTETKEGDSILK